jgi:HlyD family secretion protein
MKRVIRILVLVLVIGAIAAGGYWLYQTRFAPAQTAGQTFTQIVPVTQGPLSNELSVVGELDAVQIQDLAFTHMAGATTLKTLNVTTGNTVKAGQVLASIDPEAYQQAVDQAKSDLQAAEQKLADLQTPATALEISQADLAIAQAEHDIAQAKQDLADLGAPDLASLESAVKDAQDALAQLDVKARLSERDSLAKSERDLAYTIDWYQRRITELRRKTKKNLEETEELTERQNKLVELQADLAQVQAQRNLAKTALAAEKTQDQVVLADTQEALAQARAGGDALALAKAQLAVQEAEVKLTQAKDERAELEEGADATELAAAQADVDKKRLALADAETALAGTELKAEFDGTVLSTNVRVGDEVTATTVILTIADLTQLQVVASIDETTIRSVSVGQIAQISFDAFPGQIFQGKVLSVPLQGELQNDVMVYQVPLSLEGARDLALLVGMTANVNIATAQVDNAILVPAIALQRVPGGYQVMKVDPADPQGEPIPTPVEVGLSDGTFTQIVQGLNLGDQVVMQIQATSNENGPIFFKGGPGEFAVPIGGGPVFKGEPGGGNNRRPGGGNTRP